MGDEGQKKNVREVIRKKEIICKNRTREVQKVYEGEDWFGKKG